MTIFEGMASGFFQSTSLAVFPYLFAGSIFGLMIGVIPGLSGHFAMAMAVNFPLHDGTRSPGLRLSLRHMRLWPKAAD